MLALSALVSIDVNSAATEPTEFASVQAAARLVSFEG
jgi:hypothetical protein